MRPIGSTNFAKKNLNSQIVQNSGKITLEDVNESQLSTGPNLIAVNSDVIHQETNVPETFWTTKPLHIHLCSKKVQEDIELEKITRTIQNSQTNFANIKARIENEKKSSSKINQKDSSCLIGLNNFQKKVDKIENFYEFHCFFNRFK